MRAWGIRNQMVREAEGEGEVEDPSERVFRNRIDIKI